MSECRSGAAKWQLVLNFVNERGQHVEDNTTSCLSKQPFSVKCWHNRGAEFFDRSQQLLPAHYTLLLVLAFTHPLQPAVPPVMGVHAAADACLVFTSSTAAPSSPLPLPMHLLFPLLENA